MQPENNSNPNSDLVSPPAKQKKPWVTPTIEILASDSIHAKNAVATKESFPAIKNGFYVGPIFHTQGGVTASHVKHSYHS